MSGAPPAAPAASPLPSDQLTRERPMQISVQLYSVREALARDFPGTMQRLADLGLTIAEPFHLVEHQRELAQAAQRTGITYPSAHQ